MNRVYIFLFAPPGGGAKICAFEGLGEKNNYKPKQNKGKGKEKAEKGKGKRKKGKEKEGRDGLLLTQDNKPNLFGEKIIFFPQGEGILYIFLRCECI